MPARQSRWQAQHVACQQAVNNVKSDLTKEIEHLRTVLRDIEERMGPFGAVEESEAKDIRALLRTVNGDN